MSGPTSALPKGLAQPTSRPAFSPQRIYGSTAAVWVAAGALCLTLDPRRIALAGSLAVGWSHLVGRCGLSHFGTLTPRGRLPGQRSRWLISVLVYTMAGALSSTAVGAVLGTVGSRVLPSGFRGAALGLVLAIAIVAPASDLHLIRWRLPQPNLQTRRHWGLFRSPIPAVLWGLSLGLTFATVFTFSGPWLVLALPFALGDPVFGSMFLLAHWLGRAAPVLAGPILLDDATHTLDVLDGIDRARPVFRASNIVGIGLIALALILLLQEGIT